MYVSKVTKHFSDETKLHYIALQWSPQISGALQQNHSLKFLIWQLTYSK